MAVIKRFNNAFGTITDSPLSSTATTMNSAELPRLGAIATSGEFARVTLDPDYENGDPEIIHVTDYDGTATSATIERGKEGTTAREHASGTTWEHGPTVEDVNAGETSTSDGVAIHPTASSEEEAVAIGSGATASGNSFSDVGVAVGLNANAGNNGVSIGSNAGGGSSSAVAVGDGTSAPTRAVAIGHNADAHTECVAIGYNAVAEESFSNFGIAVGRGASASPGGIALGADTSATDNSVALGKEVSTSEIGQVHIGARHHAFSEVSDPATPPADEVRLYARDDGAGTSELAVIYPDGTVNALRDSGNVLGGDDGGNATSVVVGSSALASDIQSVVIGDSASADRDDTVLIGYNASAGSNTFQSVGIGSGVSLASGADNCVAIGESAQAQDSDSVAVGEASNASSNAATAIGRNASASSNGVAVGQSAAANNVGVAVGDSASVALNTFGIAVGEGTSCDHDESVALGRGVATSGTDQVKIGARHLALDEMTAPATPPADEARLFCRDDGSGNTEIAAIFPSGNTKVIATGL